MNAQHLVIIQKGEDICGFLSESDQGNSIGDHQKDGNSEDLNGRCLTNLPPREANSGTKSGQQLLWFGVNKSNVDGVEDTDAQIGGDTSCDGDFVGQVEVE